MAESDFKEFIVDMIKCNSFSEVLIKKTICSETIIREQETFSLSKKCDLILVIGGKHSSNTEKLYNIAKKNCKRTFHVEKVEELEQIDINSSDVVGIVTGSSTPEIELERVINFLEKFKS